MTKIKTLTIQFNTPLQRRELPLFRGAIIASISTGNILFHNHNEGSTLRYAYPLIQYKRIGGKASIVCIEEGVEAIGELLANQDLCVNIGKRKIELRIEHVEAEEVEIENSETRIDYHLRDWLALNEINYALFFETDDLITRIKMLERILVGNILSFLKGIGVRIDYPLKPVIKEYKINNITNFKHIKLTSIDIDFSINIMLPNQIGLGKHSSIGAGILTRKKK